MPNPKTSRDTHPMDASDPVTVRPARSTGSPHPPIPGLILAAGLLFGLVCGAFEITNTSIGWHIASGRWMLTEHRVLDEDVFSFTAGGSEWIDHEWLFQILTAALYDTGGAPLLIVMRMVIIAGLTLLLLRIGASNGLDPPVALVLAALCVWAARPRFFLRPELFTLLLLPLALWLFADRDRRRWWPLPLAVIVALGVNLHGAMLVAPILIGVWYAGEIGEMLLRRDFDRRKAVTGATGVAAACLAPMLNPHGPALYLVPFRLAEMVRQPHIPNPEWISPSPVDAPALYVAMAFSAAVLALQSRSPQHWLSLAATSALALRHIRNIGLFFVLLPQTTAPGLARWPLFAADGDAARTGTRPRRLLCLALVAVLGLAALLRPWPSFGFGFAERWYPDRALAFLADHQLSSDRIYNDVRFGGWLILEGFPDRRVFLDDRNEIHEPLLREIWEIFASSDVAAWERLLDRWRIDTVLLRYHQPIRVTTPDGADLGQRGFSGLWFRPERWAMVYWDDVAMVLVRRATADGALLADREYHVLRPDDLEHVRSALRLDPELRPVARRELDRALADDPGCRRALELIPFFESLESD
jgi:hypothetical protein